MGFCHKCGAGTMRTILCFKCYKNAVVCVKCKFSPDGFLQKLLHRGNGHKLIPLRSLYEKD